MDHEYQVLRDYRAWRARESPRWHAVTGSTQAITWCTAEELDELNKAIGDLVTPYTWHAAPASWSDHQHVRRLGAAARAGHLVQALGGSNSQAGAVLLAIAVPSLISPLFGWVVDRFRRRPFLVAVNLLSALMLTPLLLFRHHGDIGIIFAVAVLYGLSQTVSDGAFSALVK